MLPKVGVEEAGGRCTTGQGLWWSRQPTLSGKHRWILLLGSLVAQAATCGSERQGWRGLASSLSPFSLRKYWANPDKVNQSRKISIAKGWLCTALPGCRQLMSDWACWGAGVVCQSPGSWATLSYCPHEACCPEQVHRLLFSKARAAVHPPRKQNIYANSLLSCQFHYFQSKALPIFKPTGTLGNVIRICSQDTSHPFVGLFSSLPDG